ncbi:MAG: hypothetical protein BAJATHORv1_60118 [Candidatus Thorarchaeota archaeon]|nr:MAG: hypothetical protein BAJATHORv1_60118 [Candidatus Thorarchaeota archaeon]
MESSKSLVRIPYSGNLGKQVEEVSEDAMKIDLYLRTISSIDLQEVSRMKQLECLDLSYNRLEEVDLSGLSGCIKLREVRLQHNGLISVNLWPLIFSENPFYIDISNNEIDFIDLTPVFHWKAVLTDPGLHVQFDPCLKYIPQILSRSMIDERTKFKEPLAIVGFNDYQKVIEEQGWKYVVDRINRVFEKIQSNDWFAFQRGVMEGLGMGEIACYDGNPMDILENGLEIDSFEDARYTIYSEAVSLIDRQIESSGPTTFLDIERMLKTEACTLVPKIVDRRINEIENTIVPQTNDRVLLMPLWITSIGYSILSAMKLGLRTNPKVVQQIRKHIAKLGQNITIARNVATENPYGVACSRSYRRHIAQMVQHNQPSPQYISSRKL